jgi:hypothetical protein
MINPLPSTCKGGSIAIVAMYFPLEKPKNAKLSKAYTPVTTPGCWSNSTPQPVWRSLGAVLRLLLEINVKGGYHG